MNYLALTCSFCFMITSVFQIIEIVMARDDIDRFFECFSVILFCGMGILKLLSLYYCSNNWCQLFKYINELEYEHNNDTLDSVRAEKRVFSARTELHTKLPHILKYTEKFRSMSTILSRIYYITLVIYIMTPFVEYAFLKFTSEGMVRLPHILASWAALDSFNFVGYLVTISFELVSTVYCVSSYVSFDLTSIGIMIFICQEFAYIRELSEAIGSTDTNLTLSKTVDQNAHDSIVKCHKIHNVLIKMTYILNKLLSNIMGVYFFAATFTLCSVAVRLKSELSKMQLLSIMQYLCGTLTQLFLFCHYGDKVKNESTISMGEGPFVAAHWRLSPQIRKKLTLLGAAMMMSRRLYAGPFISIDLPSFIQVVRTAYSYYAVIRN
uniref:Odorant receptor n=1 Tax=Leucinodes orbonalis TaxID=711050 RepID=A0AAU0QLP4_9NEOP|nr:odorant receptor [Leucinodes orbonalis]